LERPKRTQSNEFLKNKCLNTNIHFIDKYVLIKDKERLLKKKIIIGLLTNKIGQKWLKKYAKNSVKISAT